MIAVKPPSEVHAAHSAHGLHRDRSASGALLLRQLGDHGLGRDEQAGDRCRTLQCRAHHFGRIDDALRDEIAVLARLRRAESARGNYALAMALGRKAAR
jgi:hypothetical protein